MLFLAILIYLVLFPLLHWSFQLVGFGLLFAVPVSLACSSGVAYLFCWLTHVYNPQFKASIRSVIRLEGIKWLAFLSVLLGVGLVLLSLLYYRTVPPRWVFCWTVPAILVLAGNMLGAEVVPHLLEDDEEPGRVVLPQVQSPAPDELQHEIVKLFQWKHEGVDYNLTLVLRKASYNEFLSRARNLNHLEWAREYAAGGLCGEVRDLAYQLGHRVALYGTYAEVSFVLSFVQQVITYQDDAVKSDVGEYPKYPVETLAESAGDCEDYAILGASILQALGYEVALLFLPGHCALGVAGAKGMEGAFAEHEGLRYYYCEMTGQGWTFGELPQEFENVGPEISPVPKPKVKIVASTAAAAAASA